jgi:hypothetical protein
MIYTFVPLKVSGYFNLVKMSFKIRKPTKILAAQGALMAAIKPDTINLIQNFQKCFCTCLETGSILDLLVKQKRKTLTSNMTQSPIRIRKDPHWFGSLNSDPDPHEGKS